MRLVGSLTNISAILMNIGKVDMNMPQGEHIYEGKAKGLLLQAKEPSAVIRSLGRGMDNLSKWLLLETNPGNNHDLEL